MIAALVIVGLLAASLGIGLVAAVRAPFGYEDETGFHFGRQEGAVHEEFPYRVPEPKMV